MTSRKIFLYIILLAAICVTAYMVIVVIPARALEKAYSGARQIGQDVREAFQITPEVTVNNTVVLQRQLEILELAVVSQQFRHEYDWTNTWMGSTKKINIKGTFEAKAGFDLQRQFRIDIQDDVAVVTLSEPILLSLTPQPDISFADESGIWNWVSPQDRSKAINEFTADAQRYAKQADFISQAKTNMEKRLTEIMKAHGKRAEIRYEQALRIEKK